MKESDLQIQVADYLRLRYPKVMFHSDFGSGIKMTKGQAVKQYRQNGGRRGWPDMFIAEPKIEPGFEDTWRYQATGMFLELKKEGTRIYKKDGSPASDHIAEQLAVLEQLGHRGYACYMVAGFDEAKQVIDDYLEDKRWKWD